MQPTLIRCLLIFLAIIFWSCDNSQQQSSSQNSQAISQSAVSKTGNEVKSSDAEEGNPVTGKQKITFIELGSVNCIPCRMMQPIMKSTEKKYGEQIKVNFYDVWKPEQKHYAQEYGIRVIPTQVFLDSNGNEIYRHEGFFPEEELNKFLQAAGLKAIN